MKTLRVLHVLVIAALCFVSTSSMAQQVLRPYPGKGGFGYINSVGIFLIPPKFKAASHFGERGVAHVEDKNRKHGFIDTNGKFVVPPAYDDLETTYREDAPMRVQIGWSNPQYGFINSKGDIVVPVAYGHAYSFRNGFALVTVYGDGPIGIRPKKVGFVDVQGNLAVPTQFDDARSFSHNGLAPVLVGKRWGFINSKGEMVIEPQFDDVPYSPEPVFNRFGVARVGLGKQWRLIDGQGKRVGNVEGSSIGEFNEDGLAVVSHTGLFGARKAGIINVKGEYVFNPQFDNFLGYKNGYAQVALDGKWGYIDTRGSIAVRPQYPFYGDDFNAIGLARVVLYFQSRSGGRPGETEPVHGYINTSGKLVFRDGDYERIVMPGHANGFVIVRKGGKSGYLDSQGKEVGGWFDEAFPFSEVGLAAVKNGEKWGYVERDGKFAIDVKFDAAYSFQTNGIAIVRIDGRFGHINTRGEFITQPMYEKLGTFGADGLALATQNGKAGYVDMNANFYVLLNSEP